VLIVFYMVEPQGKFHSYLFGSNHINELLIMFSARAEISFQGIRWTRNIVSIS
jgi:hypothetical protein